MVAIVDGILHPLPLKLGEREKERKRERITKHFCLGEKMYIKSISLQTFLLNIYKFNKKKIMTNTKINFCDNLPLCFHVTAQ
jgi:hypothetical protein